MKNRISRIVLTLLLCILIIPLFSGCQSTDKTDSYFNNSSISSAQYEYNSQEGKTKITFSATLTNGTIFNFDSFAIDFNVFLNDNKICTKTCNYSRGVKHGKTYTGNFTFYVEGEVNNIEFVSWTANYNSFWNTYKIWIIVLICIVSVASIIYLILMIVMELELEDTWDSLVEFFEDHGWFLSVFLLPIIWSVYSIIVENWVPVLLVLGGIISLILIILLMHLVQYIISNFDGFDFATKNSLDIRNKKKQNNTDFYDVEKYKKDPQMLENFSVEDLKNYCRNNQIKGFSNLNKSQLIDLISEKGSNITENGKVKNSKTKRITFDDIAGLDEAKQSFNEKIILAFEHKDLYDRYNKKAGGGILLYGLPGTGKTMFAEAASNETDSLFIPVKCSDIKSKWYGESETKVKNIFNKARKAKKAIIFFDEFEAIGSKRTDDSNNGNNDLVPQILAEMQGVNSNSQNSTIVVIAATNKPWAIDSAFLRPGRFDEKIYIPLPDEKAREKLFELKFKDIPTNNLDYAEMAKLTDGFNGADITEFCEKLKMLAIKKSISENNEYVITMEDVKEISKSLKSSVTTEDIKALKEFEKKFN